MSETQQPEDESVGVDSDVGSGFRKSLGAIVIVAVMSAGIWFALTSPDRLLSGSDEPVTPPSPQRVTPPSAPTLAFVDRATEAGVDFVHDSGARGAKLLPECLSGGVSVADLNADGKPDLVFAQGQPLDDEPTDASNAKGGIVVYRNASNANGLAFVRDASPEFGDAGLYANGFALGDVNADGKPDLYVTAVGQAQLLMNESVKGGAIAFTNRTGKAGLSNEPTWSTAAGFFDPDADGDLDLLELHYVQWSPAVDEAVGFTLDGTHRAYGPPTGFGGTLARFYLNNGNDANGTPQFVNQSAASGVEIFNASTKTPAAKSLGLVFADINHDFKVDVLIANDRVRKFALFNRSTPSEGVLFEDGAAANGFAFDRDGIATGAMGIDVAHAMPKDIGTLAVAIGNFAQEPSALYLLPALSSTHHSPKELVRRRVRSSPSEQCSQISILMDAKNSSKRTAILSQRSQSCRLVKRMRSARKFFGTQAAREVRPRSVNFHLRKRARLQCRQLVAHLLLQILMAMEILTSCSQHSVERRVCLSRSERPHPASSHRWWLRSMLARCRDLLRVRW